MAKAKKQWIIMQLAALLLLSGAFLVLQPHLAHAEPHQLVENGMQGSGLIGDPFEITNCTDLQNISLNPDNTYILKNDIDCTDSSGWNSGRGFIPIGLNNDGTSTYHGFNGRLDGQGHTITNLYINQSTNTADSAGAGSVGLFTSTSNWLANFSLTSATIIGQPDNGNSYEYLGGIAGSASGRVSNVSFDGDISTTSCSFYSQYIGGLFGSAGNIETDMTSSSGSITSNVSGCGPRNLRVGGLAGGYYQAPLTNSYSNMDITVTGGLTSTCENAAYCRVIGGLIGDTYDAPITNSYASGSITVDDNSESNVSYTVGGLIGSSYSSSYIFDHLFVSTRIVTPAPCANEVCGNGPRHKSAVIGETGDYDFNSSGYPSVYYDQTAMGLSNCDDDAANDNSCVPVNTISNPDPNYFKDNNANTPLNTWEFNDVWQTTASYPTLRNNPHISPEPPTNLVATIGSLSTINLSWTSSISSNVTGYNILCRKAGSTTWLNCDENIDPNTTQVSIEGLDRATHYEFKMVAQDTNDYWSEASEVIVGTTATPGFQLITNCQQLQDMNNALADHYELANNIDCSDTINWNGGGGFIPVGAVSFNGDSELENLFSGIFAGNTYTISDLYSNQQINGGAAASLFGGTYNALLQDVTIKNPVSLSSFGEENVISNFAGLAFNTNFINVHVVNGTIVGDSFAIGGLVAYSVSDQGAEPVVMRHNEYTGTIQSPTAAFYSGGFSGLIAGKHTVSDNYTNAAITTGFSLSSGGFVGYAYIGGAGVTFADNYAAGNIQSSGALPVFEHGAEYSTQEADPRTQGGGFIGFAAFSQGDDSTLAHNFAHESIDGFTITNGFVGSFRGEVNPSLATNYFDASTAGTSICSTTLDTNDELIIGAGPDCNAISGQPNYFKNNSTNAPLNSWDFTNTWKVTSQFPTFDARVLATITAIAPERLNPPAAGGGSGSGSVTTPSNPLAVATVSKTLSGATNSSSKPTDEVGVLGAIKHFVRSLPTIVVVGFPYALFFILGLAVVVLLIELIRELRRLHLLQILIHKQQLLAEERDAFWHLAANYLRAPVTLIVGGAEALHDTVNTPTTISLMAIATVLQTKIAEIMKKIEGSTSLQAISQVQPRQAKQVARRAVFIIPVLTVAILAILGNYAAASYRNMGPGATGYAMQIAGFILVSVLFYWVLGALTQGKNKRKQAEKLLEQQTSSLANARHELIADTANQLNPDLTKLEKTLGELNAKDAELEPAKTLHEGSSRLREIVSSFAMLIKVQEGTGTVAAAPKAIDLTSLLNKTRSKLTPQITAKGVRVVAPALPLAVTAEADLANQVLESIIANAVDYSPANGTVKVEAQQLQDRIRLRITDQGKGIDKKQLDHLFQPFVRADGKSAMDMSHGGFGINLYLDKLIMEQMGGSISAASIPGKGTAITMEWPTA